MVQQQPQTCLLCCQALLQPYGSCCCFELLAGGEWRCTWLLLLQATPLLQCLQNHQNEQTDKEMCGIFVLSVVCACACARNCLQLLP
jgi:hypothetical protein